MELSKFFFSSRRFLNVRLTVTFRLLLDACLSAMPEVLTEMRRHVENFGILTSNAPANVDAAKKLLADAGYPNGFEVRLNCPNNRYVNDEEICQNVVAMWARVGVKAQLAAENMATFIQKVQNFDSSIYLLGWGVATYDAQYSLQSLIRTRTTGADGNFNFSKISDPVVDRLTDAMKTETDVTKRNAMIREALVRTRDEMLVIPLHHQVRPWAMKAGVTTIHRSDDRPEARFTSIR